MKRWLTRIVICLLLGVVTTIAVASGCWLSLNVYSWDVVGSKTSLTSRRAPCWYVRHYERAGMYQVEAWPVVDLLDFFGPLGDALEQDDSGYKLPDPAFTVQIEGYLSGRLTEYRQLDRVGVVQAYGWPRPSLWRSVVLRPIGRITQFHRSWQNSENDNKRVLDLLALNGGGGFDPPYLESALSNEGFVRIIWSGFALDLLLYSVGWFLIYLGLRTVHFIAHDWSPIRRLMCGGLCVLLGVMTTVGVAWGCTTWVEFDSLSLFIEKRKGVSWEGSNYQHWTTSASDQFGRRRLQAAWYDSDLGIAWYGQFPVGPAEPLVPYWAPCLRPGKLPSAGQRHSRIVDASGWPLLALSSTLAIDAPSQAAWSPPTVANGIVLDADLLQTQQGINKARLLPLAPIWRGFVIDSAIYSVMWAWLMVLFILAFRGRRIYRRRSGRCIKCGYDLRGDFSTGCSECGWGR